MQCTKFWNEWGYLNSTSWMKVLFTITTSSTEVPVSDKITFDILLWVLVKCLVVFAGSDEMMLEKAAFIMRGEGGSVHHRERLKYPLVYFKTSNCRSFLSRVCCCHQIMEILKKTSVREHLYCRKQYIIYSAFVSYLGQPWEFDLLAISHLSYCIVGMQ